MHKFKTFCIVISAISIFISLFLLAFPVVGWVLGICSLEIWFDSAFAAVLLMAVVGIIICFLSLIYTFDEY